MTSIDDKIMAATQGRDSGFFCDTKVADNISNISNISKLKALEAVLGVDNCDQRTALEDISPSASLTSPSAAASQEPVRASVDCSKQQSATKDEELQVDPELPAKSVKADLIDDNKLSMTLNIVLDNGESKVFKTHMNTHKKHWKRTKDGNLKDKLPLHCKMVDACIKEQEQDPFWDTVRVSKFLEYHGSVTKNKTFRNSIPGVTGVLSYNRKARVAILHLFIYEFSTTIRLDKDLTPKQKQTGYLASGMLVKKLYTTYNEVDARKWFGM